MLVPPFNKGVRRLYENAKDSLLSPSEGGEDVR